MPTRCIHVKVPGYGVAIVRGNFPKPQKCSKCGAPATLACDWKIGKTTKGNKTKILTCDMPLCEKCTYVPAEGKDLCPMHAKRWEERQAAPATFNPEVPNG
jgi:hypothetical protein